LTGDQVVGHETIEGYYKSMGKGLKGSHKKAWVVGRQDVLEVLTEERGEL